MQCVVVKEWILEIKILEAMQLQVHMAGGQTTGGENCEKLKSMVLWRPEHEVQRSCFFSISGVGLMTKAFHIHLVINAKALGFPLLLLILPIFVHCTSD